MISSRDLPAAPHNSCDWPWQAVSDSFNESDNLPLISIVTPSFNQGRFLEETIRSVLLQCYPKLEYIVIDGGSCDASVDILKKYAPWLSYWSSEPDSGQPNAINKGFHRATGSLLGFLNSDDLLLPGALWAAARAHMQHPSKLIAGDVLEFRGKDITRKIRQTGLIFDHLIRMWRHPEWHQPGVFIPREVVERIGFFNESQQYGFDYDFMCRALGQTDVYFLQQPVAKFRLHDDSKTCSNDILIVREHLQVSKRYWHLFDAKDRAQHRRYAAEHLFCEGCSRILKQQRGGVQLALDGIQAHPAHAITTALRRLPSWISRRW